LRIELMAAHKIVYRRGAINQFLGISGDRLPIVVAFQKSGRRVPKLADEFVDALFPPRAIPSALIGRCTDAVAKGLCAGLDTLEDWPYSPIAVAIRAPLGVRGQASGEQDHRKYS
jgi:hypothetical protein